MKDKTANIVGIVIIVLVVLSLGLSTLYGPKTTYKKRTYPKAQKAVVDAYNECDGATDQADRNFVYSKVRGKTVIVFRKTGCRQYYMVTESFGRQKEWRLDYRGIRR